MKNSLFYFLTIIFSVLSCTKKENPIQRPSDEIIAIYVQNMYNYQDIILIGKVNGDTIEEISDWDDVNRLELENRKRLLNKHSTFYIYIKDSTQQININEIIKHNYECNELTVGHSNKYLINVKNEFNIATNYPDFINLLNEPDNDICLDPKKLIVIENRLRNAFKKKNIDVYSGYDTYKPFDFEIMLSKDLNNNGINEVVIKATIENENDFNYNKSSVIVIFNITKDYITDIGEIYSWRGGYNLIGITDLNNNGIYELVFQGVGYESIGFEIHEIQHNGIKRIFKTIPYGC